MIIIQEMAEVKTLFYILLVLCITLTCSAVKECPFTQYWSRLLDKCLPCSDICEPPTRLSCSDFCPAVFYYHAIKTNSTPAMHTTTTMSQLTTAVNTLHNRQLLTLVGIAGVVSVAVLFALLVSFKYTKKRSALRRKRGDAENGNGQASIELQSLKGSSDDHGNDNSDENRACEDNRQDKDEGQWVGMTVYDMKNNCFRVEGLHSFPGEGANQSDDSPGRNHSIP